MIAGHFGLAAGIKRWAPRLPLWALILGTFLLDVAFLVFAAAGLESLAPVEGARANAYGALIIHADYTHSLAGALLIAVVAGVLAAMRWGRRGGMALAAVVFSHWALDLLVHRPDLPILPGNAGNLPLIGLGLWENPIASSLAESVLVLGGAWLYYRAVARLPVPAGTQASHRRRAFVASVVTAALLLLLHASNVLGL